jgi:hypothetical protein
MEKNFGIYCGYDYLLAKLSLFCGMSTDFVHETTEFAGKTLYLHL